MENQKNTFKYLLIGFTVVVIIAGAFSDNSTDSKEIEIINTEEVDQATDLIEVEKESDKEIVSIDYEILDQSVYAPNGEKFLIMLPEDSEKEYIQQVAEEILENYEGNANELTWLFWDNQRTYNTGMGYNVGMAEWSGETIIYKWKEKEAEESVVRSTKEELEIFDYYWAVFDEEGNPRGYVSHPTIVDGYTNNWEIERVDKITSKYNISRDELFEIVVKLAQ